MPKAVRKITKIESVAQYSGVGRLAIRRRACGYARVSTDKESQESSFDNQMRYYEEYIRARPDLIFAGMYSDEGITGTSTKKRSGFNKMIEDALAGKIDLIITKSTSRFARNTVDFLSTVRQLKEANVEVFFEEQNLSTFDSAGELLITIMSSIAQEESRNISESTRWGKRKCMEQGKVSVSYSNFLGYDKGPDGKMVINEEQAEIVRLIFNLFLEHNSAYAIAKRLNEQGIPTLHGAEWCQSSVLRILRNEKYKGDALLQKTVVMDFISKKTLNNENGRYAPQYYVQSDHEAIIDPDIFDYVQIELKRRIDHRNRYCGPSIFSGTIRCGECGGWYGSRVIHSNNEKYRKITYRCRRKYDNKCSTPWITVDEIQNAFLLAVNKLLSDRSTVLTNFEMLQRELKDTEGLKETLNNLKEEIKNMTKELDSFVEQSAASQVDPEAYRRGYDVLLKSLDEKKAEHDALGDLIESNIAQAHQISIFLREMKISNKLINDFDDRLWSSMVDYITVYSKDNIRVLFKTGKEIQLGSEVFQRKRNPKRPGF